MHHGALEKQTLTDSAVWTALIGVPSAALAQTSYSWSYAVKTKLAAGVATAST